MARIPGIYVRIHVAAIHVDVDIVRPIIQSDLSEQRNQSEVEAAVVPRVIR